MRNLLPSLNLLLFLFVSAVVQSQTESSAIDQIDNLLKEKQFQKADALLKARLNLFTNTRNADSLAAYVYYTGEVARNNSNLNTGVAEIKKLLTTIRSITSNPSTLVQAQVNAAEFFAANGLNTLGYEANQQAYKFAMLRQSPDSKELAKIENNLATHAQRMGSLELSSSHRRKAVKHLLSVKNPPYEDLYFSYNGLGAAMWYASKTDSAMLYFNEALEALEKTEKTSVNLYYRPAIVLNNLSALYQQKGRSTEAISALKTSINKIRQFIASEGADPKKASAIAFQFEATDNLAGFYKELGDLRKAHDLLMYSYQQKQKALEASDPALFISQILLGQIYYAMKQYDKAEHYLESGLQKIATSDGDYLFWQADACNTLALLLDAKKMKVEAKVYYEKADSLYQQSLQGSYDDIYLDFLRNAALFYAENGAAPIAVQKATKAYKYVTEAQGNESIIVFYQLLNLSEISYLSANYQSALDYSLKGLQVINQIIKSSDNLLDSIRIELKKPKAILYKAKAEYQLLQYKDVKSLTALLKELNIALDLLERRKSILESEDDIAVLMADHSSLTAFVQKITTELYKLTNDPSYIDQLMSLHESGIYHRIRSRLERNDSLQFAHVPADIHRKEKELKQQISLALSGQGNHDEKMQQYFKATDNWKQHLEVIRKKYPKYYEARYESIFKSLGEIQKSIAPNTSLLRYFYIDKELFVMVADSKQKELFNLTSEGVGEEIQSLSQGRMSASASGKILASLYSKLWQPLKKNIRYRKVVIIPDGNLYGLNFEILTPEPIAAFKELATKSLLATYTISYHYSLFLAGKGSNPPLLSKNFVAFAPGFSDNIKDSYKSAIKDSLELDMNYLSLLPQPFTTRLANLTEGMIGGSVFLNEESTEKSFKENAANHKIIHIGTHAESNDEYPQLSRLIFAKNLAGSEEDNSLYVDEIYNCNLTSHLAVLTACESGRPGYQDGEGMISLAHAFNYAGSESIITGLWKIDEQASAILLDYFYKGLLQGLPKDEALREAKIKYLNENEGRLLEPQYWAGLVIMGDTSPINLQKKTNTSLWMWSAAILLVSIGAFIVFRIRKSTPTSH